MTNSASKLLSPFAMLYGAITRSRLSLYRRGMLKPAKLGAPVISIGNLTMGGTGKTPLVGYVCRLAAASGRKPCVLTRGYARENPSRRVLVSDGTNVIAGEREAGDEPYLLAQNLQGIAAVVSDANRVAAGEWAIRQLGCNVFVLDDGFQHLQLERDLNILTVDATNAWGNGKLLPRGILREPVEGLRRADCVVITRADQCETVNALISEIKSLAPTVPVFTSRMKYKALRSLATGEVIEKVPTPVTAFSAIGNAGSFRRQLEAAGIEATEFVQFRDHHRYSQADIDSLIEKARTARAECLITTAKDAVKLTNLSFPIPCYIFDIEIEIDEADRFAAPVRAACQNADVSG
jgi:tetraacyldisaccharide 4'-kinase